MSSLPSQDDKAFSIVRPADLNSVGVNKRHIVIMKYTTENTNSSDAMMAVEQKGNDIIYSFTHIFCLIYIP